MTTEKVKLTEKQFRDSIDILTKVNDLNFNTLKAVEEMMETSELLVKSLTKANKYKPSKAEIIEEIGDTLVRLEILSSHLGITKDVYERVNSKLALLHNAAIAGNMGTNIIITKVNE